MPLLEDGFPPRAETDMSAFTEDRIDLLIRNYTNAKRYQLRLLDALKRIEEACDTGDLDVIRQIVQAARDTPRPPSVFDGFPLWKGQFYSGHPFPEYLDLPGTEYLPLKP